MDEPSYTLIQISDLHVAVAGVDSRYGTDTTAVLESALRRIEESGLRPDAVLLTGDLTENGLPEEYRRLRAVLDAATERFGARFVHVVGNHDQRAALRAELLGVEPDTAPLDHVVRLGGLRVVVLDTSVPGKAYGALSDDQLDWLRAELSGTAPAGTVLALHHPPLPSALALEVAIELQDRARLAGALARSDVRIVLAGHTHLVSSGSIAGIPVWTAGALASTFDALAPAGKFRIMRQPTISRIDLFADSVLAATAPVEADTVAELDTEEAEAEVAALRSELPTP